MYCPNPACVQRALAATDGLCSCCGAPALLEGKYRLLKKLGSGGMGQAFLASDRRFEQTSSELCVVKEVKPELTEEREAERLLRKEASRLLHLRHPAIPSYRDFIEASFGPDADFCFLVQQYIDGEDLDQKLEREGPQPAREVVRWMEETLGILRYLHGLTEPGSGKVTPLLHLDLKPQNLMLRQADGKLFLIDFGVAAQLQVTRLQTVGAKA